MSALRSINVNEHSVLRIDQIVQAKSDCTRLLAFAVQAGYLTGARTSGATDVPDEGKNKTPIPPPPQTCYQPPMPQDPAPNHYPHRHLLGIEGLSRPDIVALLNLAEDAIEVSRQVEKKRSNLRGRTQINLFYEASTRTQASFEIAGKRLGADVMNMSVAQSSESKGETLIDTAMTLNAMRPDIIVVRHSQAGAAHLLARKVDCSVVNAGDGAHEHPTQALLDALTIRRNKGRIEGLIVAICGDVLHSRVARSNILLLSAMGARLRVVGPSTLVPRSLERLGVEVHHDMARGLDGADIVMMLRLQRERMSGALVPSSREYFHFFGLDEEKLARAAPDALVMHPGPMNRGVEIDSSVADGPRSLIREQVEMGVAVRMAVLEALAQHLPNV
jgi:aspartate carbamoyltransferase catalytic subunit